MAAVLGGPCSTPRARFLWLSTPSRVYPLASIRLMTTPSPVLEKPPTTAEMLRKVADALIAAVSLLRAPHSGIYGQSWVQLAAYARTEALRAEREGTSAALSPRARELAECIEKYAEARNAYFSVSIFDPIEQRRSANKKATDALCDLQDLLDNYDDANDRSVIYFKNTKGGVSVLSYKEEDTLHSRNTLWPAVYTIDSVLLVR